MNKLLEDYLEKIDRHLKPMPVSERADIVKEIKSEMIELELEGVLPEQIIQRLGEPKELAKAYLENSILQDNHFSWKKLGAIIAFYSAAGISGMFFLPFVGLLSVGLLFSGILAPIAGTIKFAGFLLGFDTPYIMFQFGSYIAPPPLAFFLSILFGIFFIFAGKGLWNLMLSYIRLVSSKKRGLQSER